MTLEEPPVPRAAIERARPGVAAEPELAPSRRTLKRILLLAVAGLLSASALLAAGILLTGRFGWIEGRILATTGVLAGYGLVALPAAILLDRDRRRGLAVASLGLAVAAASLALATLWVARHPEALGNAAWTAAVLALASSQTSALAARRRQGEPASVGRLFALSLVLAGAVATVFSVLLWAGVEHEAYFRVLAALVVLDLLAVALQPVLARLRPAVVHRLRVVVEPGETVAMDIEEADLAGAVARAVRTLERRGRRIVRIDLDGAAAAREQERAARGRIPPPPSPGGRR